MRAIILAAGRGDRLRPYTEDRPKCLTRLGGMTLIDRQLATLRGAGVADIVVVTGYRREMLDLPGTREAHNPLWAETNMVESLFRAEAEFGDDVIVSYGDIVYEPRVLEALLASPHAVAVAVDRNWRAYWECRFDDPLSDAESLRMDADGRITDIGNAVTDMDEIEAQYIGLMRFRGDGVRALKETRENIGSIRRPWMARRSVARACMTDLLMEMILRGTQVYAVPIEGGWLEIDTIADYRRTEAMIADRTITRFFDPAASRRPR